MGTCRGKGREGMCGGRGMWGEVCRGEGEGEEKGEGEGGGTLMRGKRVGGRWEVEADEERVQYSVFREKGEVVMRGGEGEEESVIKKRGEGEC